MLIRRSGIVSDTSWYHCLETVSLCPIWGEYFKHLQLLSLLIRAELTVLTVINTIIYGAKSTSFCDVGKKKHAWHCIQLSWYLCLETVSLCPTRVSVRPTLQKSQDVESFCRLTLWFNFVCLQVTSEMIKMCPLGERREEVRMLMMHGVSATSIFSSLLFKVFDYFV